MGNSRFLLSACRLPRIFAGFVLTALIFQVSAYGQATCADDNPPCRNDTQQPMAGHGAASSLPSNLCSNCQGNQRRVITIRIDASWSVDTNGNPTPGQTNANIWNAVNCMIDEWNNTVGKDGYTTGYWLVLDQGGQVSGPADITIRRRQVTGGSGLASSSSTFPYVTSLSPSNGNLGGGTFTASDLCGRIAHEIGHKLGLSEDHTNCNSIMQGSNSDGTRQVDQVSPEDVYQVNRNMDNNTRTNGYCTGHPGDGESETVCDQTQADNCSGMGGLWDGGDCSCTTDSGGGPGDTCGGCCDCYNQPYYGDGGYSYCEYEAHDYYTCASYGDQTQCDYQGTDYELVGCYSY